jgi:NADH:ubiquinone oxidoreductase subunit 4 (subunit M)
MNDMPILSLIIFLPLLGALGIAALPSSRHAGWHSRPER